MVTKNELKQYYWTKRRIQQLENKILELESEAERQTAILGRVLGLQVDLPKTYRLGERCLQVISGGLSK